MLRRALAGDLTWLWLAGLGGLLALSGIFTPLPGLALAAGCLALPLLLRTWPLSGWLLLLVASHLTHFRADVGPVSVRPEHVAALGVGALVLGLVLWGRRAIRWDVAGLFALGWFAVNVIATFFNAPDPTDSLRHIFRLALMVATYWVGINVLDTAENWQRAFRWFLILAVTQAAFGLVARGLYEFGINIGVQVTNVLPVPVPYGTLEEGNMFGSQSAIWLIALMALCLVPARTSSWRRIGLLIGIGITTAATLLSLARAAWVALFLGAAVIFVAHGPTRRVRDQRALILLLALPLALGGVLALAQILPTSLPLVGRLRSFTTAFTDATFSIRLADMAQAIEDWSVHPLIGWGPGTFYQLHGMRWYAVAWIANQTARTLQETGLFGLLAFWSFLGSVCWRTWQALRRPLAPRDRAALLGLTIGLLALQVAYQATDGTWLSYMWLHAALITSGARLLSGQPAVAPPVPVVDA